MVRSFIAQYKVIARSVGYRMGKAAAERQHYGAKDEWMPEFSDLFTPEYAKEAEAGYDEGLKFMRAKYAGLVVDTFYKGT